MRHGARSSWLIATAACLALTSAACDDEKKKDESAAKAEATVPAPPASELPKPKGPPDFVIDNMGPKVGFSRVLIEKKDGKERLEKELKSVSEHIKGKDVDLKIDRKAKLPWVRAYISLLDAEGVGKIVVHTDTRDEFSKTLKVTPQSQLKKPEPCTVVTKILEDRSTATWKVSGGTAMKRRKGFAGPDLTTTRETIERIGKRCKGSDAVLVSADDAIEWGLVYDLAASTQKLEELKLETVVILAEDPVAGRPVELK